MVRSANETPIKSSAAKAQLPAGLVTTLTCWRLTYHDSTWRKLGYCSATLSGFALGVSYPLHKVNSECRALLSSPSHSMQSPNPKACGDLDVVASCLEVWLASETGQGC